MTNATNVEFMSIFTEYLIYKKTTYPEQVTSATMTNHLLCIQTLSSVLTNNSQVQCHHLLEIIPPIYYISDIASYFQFVIVSDQPSPTGRRIQFMILSRYARAYHVELAAEVSRDE